MLYLVFFILLLIVIIAILLLLKVSIVLEYNRKGWDDNLIVSFYALKGVFRYKIEIPLIELDTQGIRFRKVTGKGKTEEDVDEDNGINKFFKLFEGFNAARDYYSENRALICRLKIYLKPRLVCDDLKIDIHVGSEDAFYTGMISGIMWSVTGVAISFIETNFTLKKRSFNVTPNYNQNKFIVDLYCIFHIKVVNIIVVLINIWINNRFKKTNTKNKKSVGGGLCGSTSD